MKKSQSGFTLIELVVVIVLLGILGVTALGKFQNLSANAADAAEQGIASELSSAAAINFAAKSVGVTGAIAITAAGCTTAAAGTAGPAHANLNNMMASGTAPATKYTYAFASGDVVENAVCASGQIYSCTIENSDGTATDAIASIVCTGP